MAQDAGVALASIRVCVDVELEGDPIIATGATVEVVCEAADGSDPAPLIERAWAISMAANSVRRGVPVRRAPDI